MFRRTRWQGLNVRFVEDAEQCTHLVANSIKRTLKVLRAICQGAIIVTSAWLTASIKAGRVLRKHH